MHSKLTLTLETKEKLLKKDVAYRLSQFIGFAMLKNSVLKHLHGANDIKPYVFDGLYPFEKDGIIQKRKLYVFHIKTPFSELAMMLSEALAVTESDFFKTIHVSVTHYESEEDIKTIRTVTPVSSLIDGAPWVREMGIMKLMDALIKNTSHKYKLVYGEEIPHENWLQGIDIITDKPVVCHYKCKLKNTVSCPHAGKRCNKVCQSYTPTGIIGYKIQVTVSNDPCGNAVGNLLLGAGMLEKNGVLGMGYTELIAKYPIV